MQRYDLFHRLCYAIPLAAIRNSWVAPSNGKLIARYIYIYILYTQQTKNIYIEGHKHNSVYFSVYSKAIQKLLKTYTSGSLLSAHKYYCLRGLTLIVCLGRLVSATYKIARAPNILLVVLQIWRMLQPMAFYFIRELTPNYITLSIFFTCCEASFAKKRCMLLLTAA